MNSRPTETDRTASIPDLQVNGRRRALQVAGVGALAALSARSGQAQGSADSDVSIMQVALGLEHEGIAAYRLAGASKLLAPGTLQVALVFMGHHEQHRDSLASLISKAGGTPVQPKSDDEYVKSLNLGSLKAEKDVVDLAVKLERGAANAYTGQVAALKDRNLTRLFTQLSSDEAVHWAVLSAALGQSIPTKAYLFG